MTPQQLKDNNSRTSPGAVSRAITKMVLACAVVWGGVGVGLYSLCNGVTFVRSDDGRAEHTFKDGTHRTNEGRGLSFTNPFKVADTTKWERTSQTSYFHSAPKEQDKFRAEVSISYVGLQSVSNLVAVDQVTQAAGDKALKDIFAQNNWHSYADVDPATQPQNAGKVCSALTHAIPASLTPAQAERIVVTNCEISVKVPFKGYTSKV